MGARKRPVRQSCATRCAGCCRAWLHSVSAAPGAAVLHSQYCIPPYCTVSTACHRTEQQVQYCMSPPYCTTSTAFRLTTQSGVHTNRLHYQLWPRYNDKQAADQATAKKNKKKKQYWDCCAGKIPRQKQYWDCYADASGVATDQVHNLRVQSFYTFPGSSISFVSIAQPELD